MLFRSARRDARVSEDGELILLDDQDRGRWDAARIAEGAALVDRALRMGAPGPYQLQAAIAALHDRADTPDATDWPQIAALYGELERRSPTPVVALNRAVAIAMAEGPAIGLGRIDAIAASGALEEYPYLHAARADLLRRLGRFDDARVAYERALGLTANAAERRFLRRRLAQVGATAIRDA